MGNVQCESWNMELDGFGVGPYASSFLAGDVLYNFVEDFRDDERVLFRV